MKKKSVNYKSKSMRILFILSIIITGSLDRAIAQHNTGTPKYSHFQNSQFDDNAPWVNTVYKKVQMLYRNSDLKTTGATGTAPSGNISKIYLRSTSSTVFNMKNVVIKMGQTTDTSFAVLAEVPFYNCTEVFNMPNYTISTPGWIEFELSKPFAYDKNKSLVVEFSGKDGFRPKHTNSNGRELKGQELADTKGGRSNSLFEFGIDFGTTSVMTPQPIENNVTIYPNPSSDKITLTLDKDTEGYIIITNLNGIVMKQEIFTGKMKTMSVASFENGLYFYKVYTSSGHVASGKLIVNH